MKDLILNPTDPSLLASIFLKLDQTTPQTVSGGAPILDSGIHLVSSTNVGISDATLFDFGQDPDNYFNNLPFRLFWSNPNSGSNWLQLDDGGGNLLTLRSNINSDSVITSSLSAISVKDSGLTSGRITMATTGGLLTDDTDLQWVSGNTLQVGLINVGALGKFTGLTNGSTTLGDGIIRCYAQNQTQSIAITYQTIVGSGHIGLLPSSGTGASNIYLGVTNNSQGGVGVGFGTSFGTINGRLVVWGNPANTTGGTGTVSCTINGTTITGSSTNFNIVIGSGYTITIGANTYAIREVTSATSVKIYGTIIATASGSAWSYTKPTYAAQNFAQTNLYTVNSLGQVNTENTSIPSMIFHLGNIAASTQAWVTRIVTTNNNRFEIRNDTDNTTPFWIDGNAPSDLLHLDTGGITIGGGAAGVDYTLTFDGETNDGVLTWMEDEDYFKFADDILLPDNEALKLGTGVNASLLYDGTDLVLDTALVGSGVLKLANSSNWTANGTATVTISNVAPAGVGTATISKWLTVKDNSGVVYYIPACT